MDNINCHYKEYRFNGTSWVKHSDCVIFCNKAFIDNMESCSTYYAKLGGYFNVSYKRNRRFGLVVTKIVSESICGMVRKVYNFNYDSAQV